MITEITEFLNSQLQNTDDQQRIPDGVSDCSYLISPLEFITRDGRAVWSDQSGSITDFVITLLNEVFPTHVNKDLLEDGVSTLAIFMTILLREVSELFPDFSIEEFLSTTFCSDRIGQYKQEFRTTPYININGTRHKQVLCHPMLAQAIPITEMKREGFYRRHIEPYENTKHDSIQTESVNVEFEILEEEEFDELEYRQDRFNGFDEFFDYGSRRTAEKAAEDEDW